MGDHHQHFVPQSYLKNFLNQSGNLYAYDKMQNKKYISAVDKAATENYFYELEKDEINLLREALKKEDLSVNIVDDALTKYVDGFYADIIKDVISSFNNGEKPIIKDFETLSYIIATQYYRTIAHKKRFLQNNQAIFEIFSGEVSVDFNKYGNLEHGINLFIQGAKLAREFINNYYWLFIENKTSIPFYTSDNPVVKLNHHSLNGVGVEYVFPINNQILLSIVDKESFYLYKVFHNGKYPESNVEVIKTYNEAQIHSCYRHAFSSKDNFNIFNGITVRDDNGIEKVIKF